MINRHHSVSADISHANTDIKGEIINIVATTDIHSHLNSFITAINGSNIELGGLSRIKTVIDEVRSEGSTLVLDSGDFSMGTLFQTLYRQEAFELRSLGLIGCDATVIGNHEYDYGTEGLTSMLKSASKSGDRLPEVLLCNVNTEIMKSKGLSHDQEMLLDAFEHFNVKKYTIIERDGFKIAVIGVFGENAFSCAPSCCLIFTDPVDAVREAVREIKQNYSTDMIICLSHCGTHEKFRKSEDEHIAKSIEDLDLIISGHSHVRIDTPIIYGNTAIVSPGEYGKYAAVIKMRRNKKGRWSIESYRLVKIDSSINKNTYIQNKIDLFMDEVNRKYLALFDCSSKEILAKNNIDFCTQKELEESRTETNLGDLISDAYRYSAEKALGHKIDVAIVPSGVIRDTYGKGDITIEDIFNSLSLGKGPDDISGNPLIHVYFTRKELLFLSEVDTNFSDIIKTVRLYMSGMHIKYNPYRILMNKIFEAHLIDDEGNKSEIDNSRLYSIVLDLYTWNMYNSIQMTFNCIFHLAPKNEDGVEYTNYEDAIIYYKGYELKAWNAVAKYMRSFPCGEDGIPVIPEYYASLHGRKMRCEDRHFSAVFSNLNKYAKNIITFFSLVGIVIIIIVLIIIKIVT